MRYCYSKLKFQKPVEDIVVINKFEKKKSSLAYLEPKETIYCLKDLDFSVLLLDIKLEWWSSTQVRLWPN